MTQTRRAPSQDGTDALIAAESSEEFDYSCTYSAAPAAGKFNTATVTWAKTGALAAGSESFLVASTSAASRPTRSTEHQHHGRLRRRRSGCARVEVRRRCRPRGRRPDGVGVQVLARRSACRGTPASRRTTPPRSCRPTAATPAATTGRSRCAARSRTGSRSATGRTRTARQCSARTIPHGATYSTR